MAFLENRSKNTPAKKNHLRLQIVIKKYNLFPLPFFLPPTDYNKLSKSSAEHHVLIFSQKKKYTSFSPENNDLQYPTLIQQISFTHQK